MKIIDISPELLSSKVYDGDISPKLEKIVEINTENEYNLSSIKMCCHNGAHIDAPSHYLSYGDSIEKMDVHKFVGPCVVAEADGLITAKWIEENLPWDCKRLLIKTNGNGALMENAVFEINRFQIDLIGIDNLSIATKENEGEVHRALLQNNVAILEGLDLSLVEAGKYFLVCQPLKIEGAEASPCRALLLKEVFLA